MPASQRSWQARAPDNTEKAGPPLAVGALVGPIAEGWDGRSKALDRPALERLQHSRRCRARLCLVAPAAAEPLLLLRLAGGRGEKQPLRVARPGRLLVVRESRRLVSLIRVLKFLRRESKVDVPADYCFDPIVSRVAASARSCTRAKGDSTRPVDMPGARSNQGLSRRSAPPFGRSCRRPTWPWGSCPGSGRLRSGAGILREDRRWIESFHDEPDAKRQLPEEFWGCCEARPA